MPNPRPSCRLIGCTNACSELCRKGRHEIKLHAISDVTGGLLIFLRPRGRSAPTLARQPCSRPTEGKRRPGDRAYDADCFRGALRRRASSPASRPATNQPDTTSAVKAPQRHRDHVRSPDGLEPDLQLGRTKAQAHSPPSPLSLPPSSLALIDRS